MSICACAKGVELLLRVKDSDIRLDTLMQGETSVDGGIHIGGAFSSIIPIVSLFYGGSGHFYPTDPSASGQDIFILSKGHAIAAMASVYADVGYFSRDILKGSRSIESTLNGHPGPILPGVLASTGPLGHGLSMACGYAEAIGEGEGRIFCLTGDGELQEGSNWEGILYAGNRGLGKICLIVDANNGQSDETHRLVTGLGNIAEKLESFGWRVLSVDGTSYAATCRALAAFVNDGDARPTAIISHCVKGQGGFSIDMNAHKTNHSALVLKREYAQQNSRRARRETAFCEFFNENADEWSCLEDMAARMYYAIRRNAKGIATALVPVRERPRPQCAKPRDPKLAAYDRAALPSIDKAGEYATTDIVSKVIELFAEDERVYTIDSDLGATSGLLGGMLTVDKNRALNAGIAESHMMCMSEAIAALGNHVWCSTFSVFFDWRAFRRIAVSYQERMEAIAAKDGWLSAGHGLDITFLATAPNLETQVNGATHMGIDDVTVYGGISHLKIIDISCPRQLIAAMEWVAEGGKGLVYLRVMRYKSGVLYDDDYRFRYGKSDYARRTANPKAVIISSGRGVHEAAAAADLLEDDVDVVDMHSVDEEKLVSLAHQDILLVFAEQNNGFLRNAFADMVLRHSLAINGSRILYINTLGKDGKARFIHSGTYGQLVKSMGLDAKSLADAIRPKIK